MFAPAGIPDMADKNTAPEWFIVPDKFSQLAFLGINGFLKYLTGFAFIPGDTPSMRVLLRSVAETSKRKRGTNGKIKIKS
jgi:hypothetical protein